MNKIVKINIPKIKKLLQSRGYKIYKKQKTFSKFSVNFFYTTIVGVFFVGFASRGSIELREDFLKVK